ncbi:MAG: Coenzyme F420 hydrogenase/dehydrogenase, beta subunit C-terminal domain, partial [Candidatus Thermoplasmatota archaeon]|nr:Coenzyme F420 hydrogenase/dehydrogenase, beta subunit C-terminal domain [Candidatus Thermoplasmatota archaeon]
KYVFSPVLTLIRDVQEDASINNVAVVGLPCHIEAMRNMEMDPVASRMMKKVRYIIGLNCGAPNMSERDWKTFVSETFAVSEDKIQGFRARKTGKRSIEMSLVMVGGCERTKAISINAYLKHFERSPKWPRCSLCPDYSADLSDVTFGLPLIRTEKGEELVGSAVENGYLKKGSISRAIVQKYLDVYVGYGKRRRTRKGIGLRKKEGSPYPEYR